MYYPTNILLKIAIVSQFIKHSTSTIKQALSLSSKNYTNEETLKCFYGESLQGHVYYGANDDKNPYNIFDIKEEEEDNKYCFDEEINNTTAWTDWYGKSCKDYNESTCEESSLKCMWDVGLPFVRPKRISSEFLTCSAKAACCECDGGYVIEGRYGECVNREGLFGVESGTRTWSSVWVDALDRDCDWYSNENENTKEEDEDRCGKYGGYNSNMGYTANQACCVCGGGGYTSDLMVMYAPRVLNEYSGGDKQGIERLIAEGVMYTNVALKLSGSTARIRTVQAAPDLSNFDPTLLYGNDTSKTSIVELFLKYFNAGYYYNETLGYEAYRELYGADIFAYVFEEEVLGNGYSERNYLPTQFWKRRSHFMVQRNQISTNFSLAHEIAHIFGCNHDVLADSSLKPDDGISYQWGYTKEEEADAIFHTIMSYGCLKSNSTSRHTKGDGAPCPRIPRYSNINYHYNTHKIGDVHVNNARMIERAAPCVTNFYPSTAQTYCLQPSSTVGDGICQNTNQNTHNCKWEGGDCCIETCIGTTTQSCPTTNEHCKNPHVLIGSTIVNSFQGQCMDIDLNSLKLIVNDCEVHSSTQKPQQLWYYDHRHKTIHTKSLMNHCVAYNKKQEIVIQFCNVWSKPQQWCFYQNSFSTRIIPLEFCDMDGTPGPSPVYKDSKAKNIVMKDGNVLLESIDWSWGFSNSNWLFPDEFF